MGTETIHVKSRVHVEIRIVRANSLADQRAHRLVPLEGMAEIPADEIPRPVEILHIYRLIQAESMPQGLQFGLVDAFSAHAQLCNVRGEEISRRQLYDGKRNN